MRGEDPYGQIPQPAGPYYPQAAPKKGFTAGSTWDGAWDFTNFGGGTGYTPMPTQERIATFRRRGSEFTVEGERLIHEAEKAEAKTRAERRKAAEKAYGEGKEYIEPFSAKKSLKELEDAEAERNRLYDQMRDFVAEFCAGSPTREQLDALPDHEFRLFTNYLGEQINPEA